MVKFITEQMSKYYIYIIQKRLHSQNHIQKRTDTCDEDLHTLLALGLLMPSNRKLVAKVLV